MDGNAERWRIRAHKQRAARATTCPLHRPITAGTPHDRRVIRTKPVGNGLVTSLNRPGGNATGVTIFGPAAVTKRLQLLHEIAPQATVIAFLMNPNNPNSNIEMTAAQAAASSLGKRIIVFTASSESELEATFASMVQSHIGALLGASDPFLFSRRDRLASLTARYGLPAIYYLSEFARAGICSRQLLARSGGQRREP